MIYDHSTCVIIYVDIIFVHTIYAKNDYKYYKQGRKDNIYYLLMIYCRYCFILGNIYRNTERMKFRHDYCNFIYKRLKLSGDN